MMEACIQKLICFSKDYATLLALLVSLITFIATYYCFLREGAHRPRIEFDIDCNFYGPVYGEYVAEVYIFASNKGKVRHTFNDVTLGIRGIKKGDELELWKGQGKRLYFPVKIFKKPESIIPRNLGAFYVSPGVSQRMTYNTKIPKDILFIVAKASYKYRFRRRRHSTERVFQVASITSSSKTSPNEHGI